tara:strand:- start:39811 stop:40650 length:840 start_codon:yes stop_codon:yes gene_type:complete
LAVTVGRRQFDVIQSNVIKRVHINPKLGFLNRLVTVQRINDVDNRTFINPDRETYFSGFFIGHITRRDPNPNIKTLYIFQGHRREHIPHYLQSRHIQQLQVFRCINVHCRHRLVIQGRDVTYRAHCLIGGLLIIITGVIDAVSDIHFQLLYLDVVKTGESQCEIRIFHRTVAQLRPGNDRHRLDGIGSYINGDFVYANRIIRVINISRNGERFIITHNAIGYCQQIARAHRIGRVLITKLIRLIGAVTFLKSIIDGSIRLLDCFLTASDGFTKQAVSRQ